MDLPAYVTAWIMYLLSATGVLLVVWRFTRHWRIRRTRRVVRVLAVCVLLTPINIVEGDMWLAPAYLVAGYDWILGNAERSWMAAMMLTGAFSVLLLLSMVEDVLRRLLHMEPAK